MANNLETIYIQLNQSKVNRIFVKSSLVLDISHKHMISTGDDSTVGW